MSNAFDLRCLGCGSSHAPTVGRLKCLGCGGLFAVSYQAPPSASAPRLPLPTGAGRVSLGEGGTPVLRLDSVANSLGLGNLWAKLEFISPTGSFKDRGSAILISVAANEGVEEFVEDSSGNAGASLAAYAAVAGIRAHVFAPSSASRGKLDQILVFGATLHKVDGPRQGATDAAQAFVEDHDLPYLSHNQSPYFAEGMKAVSYEINESDASTVDHVVLPVGNGSLLIGMKRGFDELVAAGGRSQVPMFHAVQSDAVTPVIAALGDSAWDPAAARPTVASGISVSRPPRLDEMVAAVRDSGGTGIAVGDRAILEWQTRLARETGVFCEATSAAALAGLDALIGRGDIPHGADVLVPITGSGLKEPF